MILLSYFTKRMDVKLSHFWTAYYQIENKLGERNLLARNVNYLRENWQAALNLHRSYRQHVQSTSTWLKSWIPLTRQFTLRRHLAQKIALTNEILEEADTVTTILLKRILRNETIAKSKQNNNKIEKSKFSVQSYKPLFSKQITKPSLATNFISFQSNINKNSAYLKNHLKIY